MSEHTPGPWRAEPRDGPNWRVHSEDYGTIAYLADPYHAAPKGEIEANARLMASAPDLLEAAKTANAFLRWLAQEGKCGDMDGWCVAQQEVSAAIAKAEGGES